MNRRPSQTKLDSILVDWLVRMKLPLDAGPPLRSKLRMPEK